MPSNPPDKQDFRASRTLEQLLDLYHLKRISIKEGSLVVQGGPHKGLEVPLQRDILYIGRADWCDLALPKDKHTSGVHCELRIEGDGFRLLDRGSRNGCYLDGHRVYDALVEPGAPISLGNTVFSVQLSSGESKIDVRYADESGKLVGQHPLMREIFTLLSRLGARDVPVLLTGETGTGKTSIAEAMHAQGERRGDFVVVNCGALSPSLIESELFGFEKGAFTGANKVHRGYFEQAHGGTLFLDEIGELPLELQPKLLDVLERKKVRRLGANQEVEVDFRLIAATHRHLKDDIKEGLFRQDLFYRLAVMELHVPSLRDRKDDIPLLATHMLHKLETTRLIRVTSGAFRVLQEHYWPGNLRELRNVLERCTLLLEGSTLDEASMVQMMPPEYRPAGRNQLGQGEAPPTDETEESPDVKENVMGPAPSMSAPTSAPLAPMKTQLAEAERAILARALEAVDWNVSRCAEQLEVSRSWLHGRIRTYDLQRPPG